MKQALLYLLISICALQGYSQSKNVLFVGNSYTGVNNLPLLTAQLAGSAGFNLNHTAHTPGGAQLNQHIANTAITSSIFNNKWDYVVLQEQSQKPSFGHASVSANVYPYAKRLCDTIRMSDSCTQPIFYMTWGRKFGDAGNCPIAPWLCTYDGMDSALAESYNTMGKQNDAFVSPVGAVWNYIIKNHTSINLYSSDNSHPSMAGSYAAACTFFTVIFRADPTTITNNSSLSGADALAIRNAVKLVCYDSLSKWNIGNFDPEASFSYAQFGQTIVFTDSSKRTDSRTWDFGDGAFSSLANPTHSYTSNGVYTVSLISEKCGITDTASSIITIGTVGLDEQVGSFFTLYPNPNNTGYVTINSSEVTKSELRIYSAEGKFIELLRMQNGTTKIDLSQYDTGLYFVEIEVEGKRRVEKLILY